MLFQEGVQASMYIFGSIDELWLLSLPLKDHWGLHSDTVVDLTTVRNP